MRSVVPKAVLSEERFLVKAKAEHKRVAGIVVGRILRAQLDKPKLSEAESCHYAKSLANETAAPESRR